MEVPREHRPSPAWFRNCRRVIEKDPLFVSMFSNELDKFKSLIQSGKSVNSKNNRGSTLLTHSIELKRMNFFDYLLSLDGIDIEKRDKMGRTPLLVCAATAAPAYFARKLLDLGADIHERDESGFTYLHLAARNTEDEDSLEVGRMVIEKGADVNAKACYGMTPLYVACEEGDFGWVSMLLYYGADATIPSVKGVLPVAVVSSVHSFEEEEALQDILFEYTFDGLDDVVQLPTLAQAMTLDSSLFTRIVDACPEVVYDTSDLEHLYSILIHLKPRHFRVFVRKFGHIVRDLIESFPPLTMLVQMGLDLGISHMKDMLYVFFESDLVQLLMQTTDPFSKTVSSLVNMLNNYDEEVEEEEVTKIVLLMVSYGLEVHADDLDTVYHYYNRNELFKILLHMDFDVVHVDRPAYSMASLYYNFNTNLEDFLNVESFSPDLLCFYNDAKLKSFCLTGPFSEGIKAKAESLPSLPSLVELSRNMARKYIVERYNIKKSVHFYTILNWLPIDHITKRMIALDKALY